MSPGSQWNVSFLREIRKQKALDEGGGVLGPGRLLGNQGEPRQRKVTAELVESDDVILMSVS